MRVLLVEDEAALREQLRAALKDSGYTVDVAADGEEGLYFGTEYPMDIGVVDLGLPKLNGIELIRQLRSAGRSFPILILTARDRWQDKVEGLGAGADDYLVKPFHVEELMARLNALVRRSAGWSQPVLRCGPIEVDTAAQQVRVNSSEIELTSFEYRVLQYLILHAGEVVSKTELTEHLYDQDHDRDSNVIEVFVARLRKKLDPEGTLVPIETMRGRGYRFTIERSDT